MTDPLPLVNVPGAHSSQKGALLREIFPGSHRSHCTLPFLQLVVFPGSQLSQEAEPGRDATMPVSQGRQRVAWEPFW